MHCNADNATWGFLSIVGRIIRAELVALAHPFSLQHYRQAVDHHIQEAADNEPQYARRTPHQERIAIEP
jgi:hypothetical protein